ncbi:MAG TPA: sulfur transferase domain-containing protein [Candidatus Binatia bacterium]|nr:sulfur transferase domain-containing protein [Candidatus Binatia bacterium]
MKIHSATFAAILLSAAVALAAETVKPDRARLDQIQKTLSSDVPRVLCLDEDFATGAQPTGDAYVKAAARGFRAVLNLRTANEGIDLARERARVETTKMRFFNIPVNSAAPRREQADEFLRLTREPANHPMLITCSSANRVGAFMMILRVVDQGWSEGKALEEAKRIGLSSATLKQFAQDYIAAHKSPRR